MLVIDKSILKKIDEVLTLDGLYKGKLIKAVDDYVKLKNRIINPVGSFDSAGRWRPANSLLCCSKIRPPSRKFPYTLNKHCRSAEHVAAMYSVDKKDLIKAYNIVNKLFEITSDSNIGCLLSKMMQDGIYDLANIKDESTCGDENHDKFVF